MAASLRTRGVAGTAGTAGGVSYRLEVRQDDLRDLVRAIKVHGDGKAIRKQLTGGLRDSVKPMVPKARRSVLSQGTTQDRSTGLRRDMARAVQVKVDLGVTSRRIGVRIRLDGKKLTFRGADRPAGLVAMYEGTEPWRHPVFGNTRKWVAQEPRGFLTEVAKGGEPAVTRRIEYVMNTISRKIDQGSAV